MVIKHLKPSCFEKDRVDKVCLAFMMNNNNYLLRHIQFRTLLKDSIKLKLPNKNLEEFNVNLCGGFLVRDFESTKYDSLKFSQLVIPVVLTQVGSYAQPVDSKEREKHYKELMQTLQVFLMEDFLIIY